MAVNKQKKIEEKIQKEIKEQIHGRISFKGPVDVRMIFEMPIPKAWPKYMVKEVEEGEKIPHEKKKDIDNFVKFYMDVMNMLVYRDDRQICNLTACKRYGLIPKTIISVKELCLKEKVWQFMRKFYLEERTK